MRLETGDVFIVPTGDGRAGAGQIVGTYGKVCYYLAIFDWATTLHRAEHDALRALSAPVVFLGLTMDAKFYAGHWTVTTRAPVDPSIPLPAYKEAFGEPDVLHVVDSTGTRRRPATPFEATAFPYRKVVAPVRLERALRASLGLEPWRDELEDLRVERVVPSASVFT